MERDLLFVLSIYPRFFLSVFIVYCLVLFCYMLMSVNTELLWFICQYLPPPLSVWAHLFREGKAVEVVPGIYAVHWKFSMCTATRTSSYSPVGPSVFFTYLP